MEVLQRLRKTPCENDQAIAAGRLTMKICIVGCGAVGSIFAGHIAKLPELEVWAYDVSQPHVDAINRAGLTISGAADFPSRLHATTDAKSIPPCDYEIG